MSSFVIIGLVAVKKFLLLYFAVSYWQQTRTMVVRMQRKDPDESYQQVQADG